MNHKQYVLVLFGKHDWDFLRSSGFMTRNGQMFQYLNKSPHVKLIIYVNPYFYSASILSFCKKLLCRIKTCFKFRIFGFHRFPEFHKVIVLDILNLARISFLKHKFIPILKRRIKKIIDCDENDLIIWLYNPAEYKIFSMFPKAKKIFDTIDNWSRMDLDLKRYLWYRKEDMDNGYRNICNSDAIIISNGRVMTELYNAIYKGRKNILTIPNGVDTDLFSIDKAKKKPIPNDMMRCKRPIIGYVGVIQERFDKHLLAFLVRNNPDLSFVIIGPIISFKSFSFDLKFKNLFLLGSKPYFKVPDYMANFDVCIVPHETDKITKYMSPMKIYEYLAMGKPVVTTPIEGIEEVANLLYIAKDYENFNQYIKKALEENQTESALLRRSVALKNSWETKVNHLFEVINRTNSVN